VERQIIINLQNVLSTMRLKHNATCTSKGMRVVT